MPAPAFSTAQLLRAADLGATVDGVRKILGVHRATAWRALARAEAEGLVERVPIATGHGWLLTSAGLMAMDRLGDPRVRECLREALGRPMIRPRGRPRRDGTYQLRLDVEEPTNPEQAWWAGDGGWEGAKPSPPAPRPKVERPKDETAPAHEDQLWLVE